MIVGIQKIILFCQLQKFVSLTCHQHKNVSWLTKIFVRWRPADLQIRFVADKSAGVNIVRAVCVLQLSNCQGLTTSSIFHEKWDAYANVFGVIQYKICYVCLP